MDDEKAGEAAATEAKASAESDVDLTSKNLASSKQQLATAHSTCLTVAADHEQTVAARQKELGVIAEAKRILQEISSGAVSQTYSLLQIRTRSDLIGSEVVPALKQLSR